MKSDYTTNSHYITHAIAFWKVGRIHFLSSAVKGLKHSCLQYIILCRVCDLSHAVLHVCVTLTITVALLVSSGIPSTLVLIPHMRREWYLPTSSPSLNQDCTGNLWPWQQVQTADSNCGPCKRGRLSEVERHSLLFIFVPHCRYSTLQFFFTVLKGGIRHGAVTQWVTMVRKHPKMQHLPRMDLFWLWLMSR